MRKSYETYSNVINHHARQREQGKLKMCIHSNVSAHPPKRISRARSNKIYVKILRIMRIAGPAVAPDLHFLVHL